MASDEETPMAAITNIYYDCLECIFDFLDLESLLNVANTCKRLQIAAAAKFGDEYGKNRVTIELNFRMANEIYVEDDIIFIAGSKFQLPFLRCFGSKIQNLEVHPFYSNKDTTIVKQYINQHCADTLTSLTIWEKQEFLVQETFKNLEKLMIYGGDVGGEFPSFANWYPNLRHLELRDIGTDFIAVNLLHLEHLGIWMSQRTMERERIADLLNANLQLQSLDIVVFDFDTTATCLTALLNMIRAHRLISQLTVTRIFPTRVLATELSQLVNEHPSMVELNLQYYQFTVEEAVAFIRQLDSLKKFVLCVQNEAERKRIRDQLNGQWKCKLLYEEQFIRGSEIRIVFVIELNRKGE